VNPYLKLIRIHNVIGAAIGDFTGYVVASEWRILPLKLLISILVVSLVAAGGYAINDVYDIEIDKINKPDRPLPSGRITLRNAVFLSYATMILGILLSVFLGYIQIFVAFITSLLLYLYAKSLKRTGLTGNFVVALTTGLSIFYGGLAYFKGNWLEMVLIPTIYSFFLTLTREIVKGIEDYEGDKKYSVRTLATTIGISKSWNIAKIMLIIVLISSPIPFFLGFNLIYLVLLIPFSYFTLLTIIQNKSIEGGAKARALLKGSAFVGMLAFALGTLPLNFLINHFP